MINRLDKWHKTKLGLLVFALIELGLSYGLISVAIDRGSLWYYLLTLVFLVGFLQNFMRLIGTLIHDKQAKRP